MIPWGSDIFLLFSVSTFVTITTTYNNNDSNNADSEHDGDINLFILQSFLSQNVFHKK